MFHIIATVLCAVFVIGYILYSAGGHEEAHNISATQVFPEAQTQEAA